MFVTVSTGTKRGKWKERLNGTKPHTHARTLIDTHDDVLFLFVPSFGPTIAVPLTGIASTPLMYTEQRKESDCMEPTPHIRYREREECH